MKFYLGNIETRWTKSAARGLRSSGNVDQKCFKYSFESLFRAKGNLSFCLVSEGRSSESEDQSPERPAKLRCGRLRSAPRLGGGGPGWGAGLPTTPPTGVPAHSRGFLLPQPALWVQTDQGRAEPSGGWWGPGSALRPCGPAALLTGSRSTAPELCPEACGHSGGQPMVRPAVSARDAACGGGFPLQVAPLQPRPHWHPTAPPPGCTDPAPLQSPGTLAPVWLVPVLPARP